LDFLNGKYDLFEVEEGVGFLARIIYDPFGVDRDDPERVISYQRCDLEEVVNADPNGVEYSHPPYKSKYFGSYSTSFSLKNIRNSSG